MTIRASDLLGHMVDNMTAENWHQGSMMSADRHGRCVFGHLLLARTVMDDAPYLTRVEAAHYLLTEVRREIQLSDETQVSAVELWNDNPQTTFEDVSLIVKRAYVEAVENEETQ